MSKHALAARAEIRAAAKVLREEWDPIGNGHMPDLPADEYDSYAPRVVGLIESGADDHAVAAYLRGVEETSMGLSARRDLLAIAVLLRRAVTEASTHPNE